MQQSVAILGRQSPLSIAELESVYESESVEPFSESACLINVPEINIERFGGIIKAGHVVFEVPATDWDELSKKIVQHYEHAWSSQEHKQTLGISVYDWPVSTRLIQSLGLKLKSSLKRTGTSLRLLPNSEPALNSASSHHNKLGLSPYKTELLIIRGAAKIIVAESTGAQNISALAARDQGRPKRDAFVGMLPPKLALMMTNMAHIPEGRILDPFCGTGVVLQEAALLGFDVYGTDLSEKMVDYSTANLRWLVEKYHLTGSVEIRQGDAMDTKWHSPIDAVVAETYLGQPFSAPPSSKKLHEVTRNCDHIISTFLKNLHAQLESGTPLCLAVPAWRDSAGNFTHLPLTKAIEKLGYSRRILKNIQSSDLLYFREDQVVARELLLLTRD